MTQNVGREPRSGCPISTTLELVGDSWTLILIRDMINGKKRFAEFLSSPERITTNILTNRLNSMLQAELIEKKLYQSNPRRYEYELTKMGRDLLPVLQAMCCWGNQHFPGTWTPPESFMK
ncbi:MAG: winged helix-turn-helix transcriptional regulator [Alphaproteobacteria bacterium]